MRIIFFHCHFCHSFHSFHFFHLPLLPSYFSRLTLYTFVSRQTCTCTSYLHTCAHVSGLYCTCTCTCAAWRGHPARPLSLLTNQVSLFRATSDAAGKRRLWPPGPWCVRRAHRHADFSEAVPGAWQPHRAASLRRAVRSQRCLPAQPATSRALPQDRPSAKVLSHPRVRIARVHRRSMP